MVRLNVRRNHYNRWGLTQWSGIAFKSPTGQWKEVGKALSAAHARLAPYRYLLLVRSVRPFAQRARRSLSGSVRISSR
jgi:hypothetical protein